MPNAPFPTPAGMVSTAAAAPRALIRARPDLYEPDFRGWTDPYAEQGAQDLADEAMARLGCHPQFCEVCGSRLYVLDGRSGPFHCGDCATRIVQVNGRLEWI